jgi:predicted Zn-dependent protease with MMP-like domain/Flp pilus assembly protein TadD
MTDATGQLLELIDDAWDLIHTDDLKEARKRHQQACRLQPDHREVVLLEAELLKREGSGDEAVMCIEQARDKHPGDMLLDYTYATLLLDVYDDVPGARPLLEDVKKRLDAGESPGLEADIDAADAERAEGVREDFHIDLLLTLSDCRGADLDPRGALSAAEEAMKLDPDDPQARICVASARFDLGQLDGAEQLVAQAIDRDPRLPDAYWLRGRILTLKGDDEGADRAFERACLIDPDRFSAPVRMDEDTFAKAMEESLQELPQGVQDYLSNVAIAVEDTPPLDRLAQSDPPLSPGLLGLYEGTPPALAEGEDPWAHHPSHITLFRKNIEITARDGAELRDLIATTLWHEIGHYLGLDEEDLEARGLG